MTSQLRIATAGSVDDGKSTLVGRLLHDTKNILVDQLEAIERVSEAKGLTTTDLALLTDGLRAEREQGITIDVAYRYFATSERSFVLADCPGHVQYTRNTVTGASTADVLVVLVDVTHGVLEQTRRHLAVGALLGVPHVAVAVNKIDLVDDAQERCRSIGEELQAIASELGVRDLVTFPVSALHGDNVAARSKRTPWYAGPSLLEWLTELPDSSTALAEQPFALAVQYVLRPQLAAREPELVDYRGYAGTISSGSLAEGDEVVVLPGGQRTRVTGVDADGGSIGAAVAGQAVAVRLADQIDVSRGDLLVDPGRVPAAAKELDVVLCWLDESPLREGARVLVKHTTRVTRAVVASIDGRLDLDSLRAEGVSLLALNDIGRVHLRLAEPVHATDYAESHALGSLLVIDPTTGRTCAAGMVQDDTVAAPGVLRALRAEQSEWVI